MSPKHIIYKKLSRDKSVSVYFSLVCVSDGVVLVDPEQVKGKKGETRSQTDGSADTITVLTDMSFYFEWVCVVISENVCVFSQFPDNLPCSVCLQPGPTDRCAVEFEVKAFCAENQDEKGSCFCCLKENTRQLHFLSKNIIKCIIFLKSASHS
uniref:S-antigen; retina and pineal gland (arrestin) b n=1 Tax=Cyprinus carpio TaxID=7962 RepID=A0A8C1RE07_CYPCA